MNVGPTGGLPGRRLRIGARGFTTGTTLYAHVVRGRSVRSRRVGRLRSPCGKLLAYKRLFGENAAAGRYEVQFDTIRSYRPRTPVRTPSTSPSGGSSSDHPPQPLRARRRDAARARARPVCAGRPVARRRWPSESALQLPLTLQRQTGDLQRTARCSKSSSTRRRQRSSAEAAGSLEPAELPQGPVRERVAQGQHAGIA